MMKFFRKNMAVIFGITAVGFLAGIFIGFGGYFFGRGAAINAIATINGVNVPFRSYTLLFNRVIDAEREKGTEISDEALKQKQNEVIQELVQEEVFWQEAKKYGITVTDEEVAMDINSYPAFQRDGRFDQQAYFQLLSWRLHMTPQEFEESRRRQIAIIKLRRLVTSGVKVTEREVELEYMARKGNMKNFEKEKDNFYLELLQEKTLASLQEWYKAINTTLKVKVHTENIQ